MKKIVVSVLVGLLSVAGLAVCSSAAPTLRRTIFLRRPTTSRSSVGLSSSTASPTSTCWLLRAGAHSVTLTNLGVVTTRLSVTPSEIQAAVDSTMALIADHADSVEDAMAIYRRVVESLYEEGEDL